MKSLNKKLQRITKRITKKTTKAYTWRRDWYSAWFSRQSIAERICIGAVIVMLMIIYVGLLVAVYRTHIMSPVSSLVRIERVQEMPYIVHIENEVRAEGVIIHDQHHDAVLYERNADSVFGIASLTKIMTALIVLEHTHDDIRIPITADSLRLPGDHGLLLGDVWDPLDLAEFMMITSSNDAAHALASHLFNDVSSQQSRRHFIEHMNTYARNLGLSSLVFFNETGLDDRGIIQVFGTSRDVMELVTYAYETHPEFFTQSALARKEFSSLFGNIHFAENTNRALENIPSHVFSKTGYTGTSGGSLAFMFERSPGDIVTVVLMSSTFWDRFDDARTISQAVFHRLLHLENR